MAILIESFEGVTGWSLNSAGTPIDVGHNGVTNGTQSGKAVVPGGGDLAWGGAPGGTIDLTGLTHIEFDLKAGASGETYVMLQSGSFDFAESAHVSYEVGQQHISVAIADFTGDLSVDAIHGVYIKLDGGTHYLDRVAATTGDGGSFEDDHAVTDEDGDGGGDDGGGGDPLHGSITIDVPTDGQHFDSAGEVNIVWEIDTNSPAYHVSYQLTHNGDVVENENVGTDTSREFVYAGDGGYDLLLFLYDDASGYLGVAAGSFSVGEVVDPPPDDGGGETPPEGRPVPLDPGMAAGDPPTFRFFLMRHADMATHADLTVIDMAEFVDVDQIQITPAWSSNAGSFSVTLPIDVDLFHTLNLWVGEDKQCYIETWQNGVKSRELSFLIGVRELSWNGLDSHTTFTGQHAVGGLNNYAVKRNPTDEPQTWIPSIADNAFVFMKAILDKAHSEGYCKEFRLSTSCTATHDSNGAAWANTFKIGFDIKQTALDILMACVANDLCEFKVIDQDTHFEIRLYNPGTMGADLYNSVFFDTVYDTDGYSGTIDYGSRPSRLQVGSNYNGLLHEVSTGVTRKFPKILPEDRNGLYTQSDTDTYTNRRAYQLAHPSNNYSVNNLDTTNPNTPVPFVDFRPGDKVSAWIDGGAKSIAVQGLTMTFNGTWSLVQYSLQLANVVKLPPVPKNKNDLGNGGGEPEPPDVDPAPYIPPPLNYDPTDTSPVYSGGVGGLPPGGATGQVLAKKTPANGDVEWREISEVGDAGDGGADLLVRTYAGFTGATETLTSGGYVFWSCIADVGDGGVFVQGSWNGDDWFDVSGLLGPASTGLVFPFMRLNNPGPGTVSIARFVLQVG